MATKTKMIFVSRLKQIALEIDPEMTPSRLQAMTGQSLNTVKRWWNNEPVLTRLDGKIIRAFMAALELERWYDLLEPELYEAHTEFHISKAGESK